MAKGFSQSTLVPKEYQNNIPNSMIALSMADRVGADPLMVMQNLVIVHGRPTWSSQFLIATANSCGRFSSIRYEFFGTPMTDEWGARAWAIEKSTGEKLVGSDVTIALAKKEGWYQKSGSKWQTIPQQMLMYRAGSWWVRAYAPELSLGLHTADEAIDIIDVTRGNDGVFQVSLDAARDLGAEETTAEADRRFGQPHYGHDEQSDQSLDLAEETTARAIAGLTSEPDLKSKEDFEGFASMMRIAIIEQAGSAEAAGPLLGKFNTAYLTRMRAFEKKR